ncbi:hypothetical protein BH23VER1_BH23VER1_37090 [soil metagenome]
MTITRALLLKELRQHGLALLAVAALVLAGCQMVQRALGGSGMGGSDFQGLGIALVYLLPIGAIIVGHLLVAIEFRQKSQLFIEALPLPRWRMVAVKFALGLVVMVGIGLGALALAWEFGGVGEIRSARFATILATKTAAWSAFVYCFFFLVGFLGRYRIAFLFLLFWGLLYASNVLHLPLSEFPPFALVDANRFGFEREILPAIPLLWTLAISLGFALLALALALVREGSVAARLGETMSHREKLLVGMTVFGVLMTLAVWDMRRPDPFELPGAATEESGGVSVSVSSSYDAPPDRSIALAARLARILGEARQFIGVRDWPAVFVVDRTGIDDGMAYDESDLDGQEGALFYADLAHQDFDGDAFARFVLQRTLAKRSHGRLDREATSWVLAGFARYWHPSGTGDQQALASAALREADPTPEMLLEDWFRFERDVGEEEAAAVAWAGLKSIEHASGRAALARFLGSVLGRRFYPDSRATLDALRHPPTALLESATGMDPAAFAGTWKRWTLESEPGFLQP